MFVIQAKERSSDVKLEALRKQGEIPAVFYGADQKNTSVAVPMVGFKKVWREAGESSAIKLAIDGKNIDVLIHEVQLDPITSEPIHVDFLAIDMTKKVQVGVPLVFEGVSDAVKSGIGNLVKVLHEIEIEALPADLPHNLVVDISKLATLEDVVTVADIALPQGVMAITKESDIVASIVAQVEEKEETPEPIDLSEIEVEKKGKKEEEGAEGAAEAPAESSSEGTDNK